MEVKDLTLKSYVLIMIFFLISLTVGCGGDSSGNEETDDNISYEYDISIDTENTEFVLFNDYAFPTFMSHLFGGKFNFPDGNSVDAKFAKVTLTNNSDEYVSNLRLEVGLTDFSQSTSQVFDLAAFETKTIELTPDFDETALLSLNEEISGNIRVKLSDFQGNILDEYDNGITLLSKNDMVWHVEKDGTEIDLTPFVCTFVTPRNEQVKLAIGEAKEYMFNKSLVGYQNLSGTFEKEVDYNAIEEVPIYLQREESLFVTINSIETLSEHKINDFWIKNSYGVWVAGYLSGPIQEGATINFTITSPHAEGWYYIVFDNSDADWVPGETSKVIRFTRSLSHYEIVYYQSKAIYDYLKNIGISYVSSTVSFLENTQAIRYPSEVLETLSGNCIDLTVLFASMLEAIDMNPLIVIIPGHAFLGTTSWSDYNIDYIWREGEQPECQNMHLIETTMINSANFTEAWDKGHQEMEESLGTNKIINIKKCRDLGITPAPIN